MKEVRKKEDDSNKKKKYLEYLTDEMVLKQKKALESKELLK